MTIAFAFTSCNKCQECESDNYYNNSSSGSSDFDTNDDFGHQIMEVCSDNFESKKDFNDYIDALEKTDDWECKSDFWN